MATYCLDIFQFACVWADKQLESINTQSQVFTSIYDFMLG